MSNANESTAPLLSVVAVTDISTKTGKIALQHLVDHGLPEFRNLWTPVRPFPTEQSVIVTLNLSRRFTFAEAAMALDDLAADMDAPRFGKITLIGRYLKKNGFVMTLTKADEMVEYTEHGDRTGLRTDGGGNFAFVENKDGSISVLHFFRAGSGWNTYIRPLRNDIRFEAGSRLLVSGVKELAPY